VQKLMNGFLSVSIGALVAASCIQTTGEVRHDRNDNSISKVDESSVEAENDSGSEVAIGNGMMSADLCFDEIDNDGDGKVDCDDSDCCWACLDKKECKGDDWVLSQVLSDEVVRADGSIFSVHP
jgi:hypothetical protein